MSKSKPKEKKKKKDRERYLVRRIVDGLCGWLTFKQTCGERTLYCEHFLYQPIHDIAKGRGWSVLAQEPIKAATKKSGAPCTIDFTLYKKPKSGHPQNGGFVIIEIKFLRDDNRTMEIEGVGKDLLKMRNIAARDLLHFETLSSCGEPERFMLVVAQRSAYQAILNSNPKKSRNKEIVQMLRAATKDKSPKLIYKSIVETKLKEESHWTVIAFGEAQWPEVSSTI